MLTVILTILAVLIDHLDKIVILLGKETFIKRIGIKLPNQLVLAASRLKEVPLGLVIEMIRYKNNDKNEMFYFRVKSLKVSKV